MDLDNISDINILKDEIKKSRAKMKVDAIDEDTGYVFKKDHWYITDRCRDCVKIFSDDCESAIYSSYQKASNLIDVWGDY